MNKIFYRVGEISEKAEEIKLPQNILDHISKYTHRAAYNQSLSAWTNLEKLLNQNLKTSLFDLDVVFSKRGKPISKKMFFSLSHTDEFFAVCASKVRCGIDIEKNSDRTNFDQISQYVFDKSVEDKVSFYEKWTQFEGMSKMLDIPLKEVKNLNLKMFYHKNIFLNDHTVSVVCDKKFELLKG